MEHGFQINPLKHLVSVTNHHSLLVIMATEQEYGVKLRSVITPFICGVGPVESAISTTRILLSLPLLGSMPKLVVVLGSAGSRTLNQGDVYQASSVTYRDMDASPLGFPKGETPFLALPSVIQMPIQIPGIPSASLSTGANIVTGDSYDDIEAEMVDMETWAIMRAASQCHIPTISLRGISDGNEEVRQFSDWTKCLGVIDEKLAHAFELVMTHLRKNW